MRIARSGVLGKYRKSSAGFKGSTGKRMRSRGKQHGDQPMRKQDLWIGYAFVLVIGVWTVALILLDSTSSPVTYSPGFGSYKGSLRTTLLLTVDANFPWNDSARCTLVQGLSIEELLQEAKYLNRLPKEWIPLPPAGQTVAIEGTGSIDGDMVYLGIVRVRRTPYENHVFVDLKDSGEGDRIFVLPVHWPARGSTGTATLSRDSPSYTGADL
ncbi:MAG: hypothetical protein C0478_11645 [Planctomyces sp.]|nr:hypothetical protein [Planctomyces sp.]